MQILKFLLHAEHHNICNISSSDAYNNIHFLHNENFDYVLFSWDSLLYSKVAEHISSIISRWNWVRI